MADKNPHRNKEHYPDPTAGKAIKTADKAPEEVDEFIRIVKKLAGLCGIKIKNRLVIEYKGRLYK